MFVNRVLVSERPSENEINKVMKYDEGVQHFKSDINIYEFTDAIKRKS